MSNNIPSGHILVNKQELIDLMGTLGGQYSKRVADIIGMSKEDFIEHRKELKFEEVLNSKSLFMFLNPGIIDKLSKEDSKFLRTLVSIGATAKHDLSFDNPIEGLSYKNTGNNYKYWLGEKLHLTKKEIKEISIEKIDKIAKTYLTQAISHIKKYIDLIPEEFKDLFKSEYFDSIHKEGSEQLTVGELLIAYQRLQKDKKVMGTNNRLSSEGIRNHSIAQYEIQRLLALAMLYRDREQNHEYQYLYEDESFIKAKLTEIFMDGGKPLGTNPIKGLSAQSGLYDYTTTKKFYVSKNEDGTYNYGLEKPEDTKSIETRLHGTRIIGKRKSYQKEPDFVDVMHIGLRTAKDAKSVVDKYIMKAFSSFTEVLDQKGLIIVLPDLSQTKKLEEILAYELGSDETSWIEEMEDTTTSNINSSSSYSVRKGILKFGYKAKSRKQKMKEIKDDVDILKNSKKELREKIIELKKLNSDNEENGNDILKLIQRNEQLLTEIEKHIGYLKDMVKSLTYNIEIEIQIFDIQSYLRAEVDKESPAYHEVYKKYQRMFDLFPKYFPQEVYGKDNLKSVIMPVIEEKLEKDGSI